MIEKYTSGTVVTHYPDDLSTPGGHYTIEWGREDTGQIELAPIKQRATTSYLPNGDQVTVSPGHWQLNQIDGTVTTEDVLSDGTTKTVTKTPDGAVTTTLPDGRYITDEPDGTVISFTPSDGTTITEKPDHTKFTENKDGTWNIVFPLLVLFIYNSVKSMDSYDYYSKIWL